MKQSLYSSFIIQISAIVSIMRYSACLILLAFMYQAQPAHAGDMIDLYKLAQKNDPELQGAEYKHKASGETLKQAYSNLLPTLAAEGEYIDTAQDIISSDNTVYAMGETDFTTKTYTLTLTQPILDYATIVRLGQAKAEIRRADMEFELAKQNLILQVAELYLEALSAQDNLAFSKAEQAADEAHFELAEGRYNMGLAPITDLHDAEARMTAVRAETIAAENQLDDALEALREVCGKEIGTLAKLKQEFPLASPDPAEIDAWIQAGLDQNLGIQVQRHAVEVAEREVRRQKSAHWPTLDLIGRHNYRLTDGTLFGGGSEVETTEVLLQANITLFQGGYVCSRVREARQLYKAALQDMEQQKRAVKRQSRAAYLGVKSAISRVKALEQAVGAQQLSLDAKQYGFKSGLYTSLAVLDAERDLYLDKQRLAQARYDYIFNSLRLKQAAGTLCEENLVMVNEWFN